MIYLFIYAAILLGFGLYEYKFVKDRESFTVTSRKSSALKAGISIVASSIGGTATIGMIALSKKIGFPAIWWLLSGVVGLLLLAFLLASKVRQSGALTLPEMIEQYMGKNARVVSAWIIVIAWSSIVAAQFMALANISNTIWSIGYEKTLILGAILVISYSFLGGQSSVIKSDVIQFFIMIFSFIVVLAWLVFYQPQSFENIHLELFNAKFGFEKWSYYLLILGGGYIVCPMLYARILSTKDEKSAKNSVIIGIIGLLISAIIIIFISLAINNINTTDELLTSSFFKIIPQSLGILFLLGLFSAIISSADSCLITASSVFCNDILKTKKLRHYRLYTVIIGILALIISFNGKDILSLLLAANDVYTSGIVAPVFIMLLTYKKYNINKKIIFLAILLGGTFGLIAAISEIKTYSFIGIFISILLSLLSLKQMPKKIKL